MKLYSMLSSCVSKNKPIGSILAVLNTLPTYIIMVTLTVINNQTFIEYMLHVRPYYKFFTYINLFNHHCNPKNTEYILIVTATEYFKLFTWFTYIILFHSNNRNYEKGQCFILRKNECFSLLLILFKYFRKMLGENVP